jgi:alpha-tubulin suppressor-like RCC1 family protein
MTSGFKVNGIDTDDLWVRRDPFTEGGVWSWGHNSFGGLGDETLTHRSSPVQITGGGSNWKLISNGGYNGAAGIRADGSLWTWGRGTEGQLGNGAATTRSSPVQVSNGPNWKYVSSGQFHNAALKVDGSLWTWGYNIFGQLGDNTTTNRSSPVQTICGGNNWKYLGCGYNTTNAIKDDGTLWVWGSNQGGALGDGTILHRSSPIQTVAGGTNWKSVTGGFTHTAAIKTDGTLWNWGNNITGAMGDNTVVHRSSPVQTIAGGTDWKLVTCGDYYTAAVKTDGTLWLWGNNLYGQLASGNTTHYSSPVQNISFGTDWKKIDAGHQFMLALKNDGSLWTWGRNTWGQLGDGTILHRSIPIQTITAGTNWKDIGAGTLQSHGIREDYAGAVFELDTVNISISANTSQVNLMTLAGDPSLPANYIFTIETGVIVYSTSTAVAAITTGAFPALSTLKIVNNGSIIGKGGNGGNGRDENTGIDNGDPGGPALSLGYPVSIDNTNGFIFGGGGGGGGGGAESTSIFSAIYWGDGGGGGGGRSGLSNSSGGAKGNSTNGVDGVAGSPGTLAAPGAGGAGGEYSPTVQGTAGGAGGQYGTAGSDGADEGAAVGGSGGAAGKAINLNSQSVTWLAGFNGTKVKGAIS